MAYTQITISYSLRTCKAYYITQAAEAIFENFEHSVIELLPIAANRLQTAD